MPYPLCEHVMSSGLRCGSPAQRGQTHCHYHASIGTLLPRRFLGHENFRNEYERGCRLFPMPLLEDATSIQTALMQVIHAMLEGAIHVHSARIVLSALRTAQRNLPAVKLEMAASTQAAVERELPTDAAKKYEVTWANRADDKWETSYIGRNTVSPAHLNGDLGYREPKIPPDTEGETGAPAPAVQRATQENPQAPTSNDSGAPPVSSPSGESAAAAAPPSSPGVGGTTGSSAENDGAVLPFPKPPEPVAGALGDRAEPGRSG